MKNVLYFILLLLLFSACANKVTPTGGSKDILPPALVNVFPENNLINFNASQIVFTFDEFVQLNDATNQILISPIPEKQPTIKAYKKTVTVTFESPLIQNTTYSINFGKSVADVHEGNINDTIHYVFSTGDYIDSLSMNGKVQDASTLKSCAKYSVFLYSIVDRTNLDSLLKNKPSYCTRTNESGNFEFNNLRKGSYYLVALDDKNNNNMVDAEELVGFVSGVIDLPVNRTFVVKVFKPIPTELRLLKSVVLDQTTALVNYNLPASINVKTINNKLNINQFEIIKNDNTDSVFIHLKDTSIEEAQLLFSDGQNINDTISFSFGEKKKNDLNLEIKNIQHTSDTLMLLSNHPIKPFPIYTFIYRDTTMIDSLKLIPINSTHYYFDKYNFKQGERYRLELPKGRIEDIYGNMNDSMVVNISLVDKEHSGNVALHLDYSINENPYLIQLLNSDFALVDQQRILKGQNIKEVHFDYLMPGKYYFRVVNDNDNDQKLSMGVINKKQPESIWMTDLFSVRANWDLDISLKLDKEYDRPLNEPN